MTRSRSKRLLGLTLIELLIAVAVVAILITTVGPSFRRMIEMQRLRSINSQLVTDLQFARSEAVARGRLVRVTFYSNADATCYSIYTYTDNANQCDCRNTPACTFPDQYEIKTVRIPTDGNVRVVPWAGLVPGNEFAYEPVTGALYKIPTDFVTPPLTQYVIRVRIDVPRTLRTVVALSGRPSVCTPPGSTMSEPAC